MTILGDAIQQARQFQGLALEKNRINQEQQAAERQRLGVEALNRYRETAQAGTPDENAMTTALIYNPEAAQTVLAHIGIQDKRQKQDAASFALRAATIADNPQQFMQAIDSRIAYLQQAGRDPKDTIALREQYAAGDTAGAKAALKSVAAALVGDGTLDKSAYEMAFGKAPESLTEWQKANLDLDKQRLALQQSQLANQQARDNSYVTYMSTPDGIVALNSRKAEAIPITGPTGTPLVKASDDPTLQGRITQEKTSGKTISEAKANLPKVESAARFVTGYVDSVLKHPGRPWSTGLLSLAPTIRGTKQADFRNRLGQIGGQSFLQAFETLRGGGQITQVEGEKATTAINRMKDATSDEEFNSAAQDFKNVVESSLKNARDLASGKALQPINPGQDQQQNGDKEAKRRRLEELRAKYNNFGQN